MDTDNSPPSAPQSPVLMFDQHVTRDLLHAITATTVYGYSNAVFQSFSDTIPELQADLRSAMRRCKVNEALLELPAEFDGLQAQPLTAGAAQKRVELRIAEVILTPHRVQSANAPPPEARYSEAYRIISAQGELFEVSPPLPLTPGKMLYAVLLHGGASAALRPEFAMIKFPITSGEGYHEDHIDLVARFPDLFRGAGDGTAPSGPSAPTPVVRPRPVIVPRRA